MFLFQVLREQIFFAKECMGRKYKYIREAVLEQDISIQTRDSGLGENVTTSNKSPSSFGKEMMQPKTLSMSLTTTEMGVT